MFGVGFAEMLGVVVMVVILGALGLTSRAGSLPALPPVLVLRRFRVSEAPPDGVFVDISGRPQGLVAWLLSLLRLDDETRLQLTATSLSIRRASLRGQALTIIPLGQVGSTLCGFRKPLGFLAIGMFFAAWSLFALLGGLVEMAGSRNRGMFEGPRDTSSLLAYAVVLLLLAAAFILAYFLQKQMVISVGDNRAQGQSGLTFKPSLIEGVPVDINRVIRATELINRKMLEAQLNPAAVAARIPVPSAAEQRAAQRPAARAVPRCAGCGAALEADSSFCAECGRSVEP